jgi:predicted metal-binding protein
MWCKRNIFAKEVVYKVKGIQYFVCKSCFQSREEAKAQEVLDLLRREVG